MESTLDLKQAASRGGYLPIPLESVPPQSLEDFEIYLCENGQYSLYRGVGLTFRDTDRDRLVENGVKWVYVSAYDHHKYYQTVEKHLKTIVSDPKMQKERQSELLYSTSLELASQLLQSEMTSKEFERSKNVCEAVVQLALNDREAFRHLFDVSNHDFYTATHLVNVCTYSVPLAQKMGLNSPQELQNVAIGALLHDIGKTSVPSRILNTTEKLTDQEFDVIKSHVTRGVEQVQKLGKVDRDVINAIAHHHERLDGSGYPAHLQEDNISMIGRIVAVVDTFDAMTSVRPYRKGTHSVEKTLRILNEEKGSRYDTEVVNAFTRMIQGSTDVNVKDLIEAQEQDGGEDGPQRRHPRYFFRIRATIRFVQKVNGKAMLSEPEQMIVHNISRSGVAFLSPKPLAINTPFIISLARGPKRKDSHLFAVAVRVMDNLNGWFTVGAQFSEFITENVIQQLRRGHSA